MDANMKAAVTEALGPLRPVPGSPTPLDMYQTNKGVAEVYMGELQVGMITWNPDQMTSLFYATYANGDDTIPCANREEALNLIQAQHAVVQRLARSVRSIRPASEAPQQDPRGVSWDFGYNTALRDVEKVLREAVGPALAGEGYTAITE
jgi:hypothetical protein